MGSGHQLIDVRRSSDNRKARRCTICNQEWTGEPGKHVYCPNVPVIPWGSDHGNLRTRTQAKKEHYLLPEDAKPVAALRLDKDPWYVWLYDVGQCEQRLPSEEQVARAAHREYVIRERYGCKMCTRRYLKEGAGGHINGVCYDCRNKVRDWHQLLAWARSRVTDELSVLDLVTDPPARPMDIGGLKFRLIGYRSYDLSSGALLGEGNLVSEEDYASFFYLLHMAVLDGPKVLPYGASLTPADKPLFLFCGYGDLVIFWAHLQHLFGRQVDRWPPEALTTSWPLITLHIPKPDGVDWLTFPDRHLPQSTYYARLCDLFGLAVEPDVSVPAMLREVILYLAEQQPIEGV